MKSASRCRKPSSRQTCKLFSMAAAVLCCVAPLAAQAPSFVSFDAPDAGKGANQGTIALCVNQGGTITGHYVDAAGIVHGFVRLAAGQITEFDPPGLVDTFATAINNSGRIVGYSARIGSHGSSEHGYLRTANGQFAAVDAPGAADTLPYAINDRGEITGAYDNSTGSWHSFLRDASGNYTVLDAPNAGTGPNQGTTANSINANGVIAGYYADSNNVNHGFVRDQFGNYTSFDGPGAGGSGTFPSSINLSGEVTGTYSDNNATGHSFLRDASGNVVSVDMPGVSQTFAATINDLGAIVGEVTKGSAFAGFRRDSSGNFHVVSAPVPNSNADAISINNNGRITGFYVVSGTAHGFVE